jgi:hypothetical protein
MHIAKIYYIMIIPFIFIFMYALDGCSSGNVLVIKPLEVSVQTPSIQILEGKNTVGVPQEVHQEFVIKLNKYLFQDSIFVKGDIIHIVYKFIQLKQPGIWDVDSSGPIGSRGESLSIEAKFFDTSGKELSTIQAECMGSKLKNAADRAAWLIAEYTKQNFKKTK